MPVSLTIILIGITVWTSYRAWKSPMVMDRWMFTPYEVKRKSEWDRFILSGLIHKDQIHLFFNMFTFYFFGSVIEKFLMIKFGEIFGLIIFLIFYVVAIIISDIPTYLKNQDNYGYRALGASGGVAAMVFGSILIMPLAEICLFGLLCLPGIVLGLLFLVYSMVKAKQGEDGINHDAHLYGGLFGIIFMLLIAPGLALNFWDQISNWSPLGF